MSGIISKRQQARNEKQLHELVHTLGVFLCMRCAAIHRKLGTHVSKVKSLSMDSWTNEQVDNMRKVGNVASNQIYNPENKKPPVPIDADEADSAMERFIRQKYIHIVAAQASKPASPISDEGTPPPLPPKNSKFGFRAAFSRSKTMPVDKSPNGYAPASPTLPNKPSKVFGATVDYDGPDDTDKKLVKLRDMGFQNNQRNAIVLKGVSGDLDRAVEALVRLGEGDRPPPAPPKEKTLRATRSLTPMMPNSSGYMGGLNVAKRSETDRPTTSSTTSTNPFDMLNRAQPQTAHSTGSLQNTNPYTAPTNPFASMSAQASPVDQAFQNLTISGQPTGTSPNGAAFSLSMQPHPQMYQHSAPASPQPQHGLGLSNNVGYPFNTQQQQPQSGLQPQPTGYNPFFAQQANMIQQQQQPQYPGQNGMGLNTNQIGGQMVSNPFVRSPTRIASPPPLGQISETATFSTSPMPLASPASNPFFAAQPNMQAPAVQQPQQYMQQQQQQQQMYQQQSQQQMQQPQQFVQQPFQQQGFPQQQVFQPQQAYQQYQAPRHDKASIMALYGQLPKQQLQAQASIPENQAVDAFAAPGMPAGVQQPRSVSQPLPGSNPFAASMQQAPMATAAGSADAYKTGRQISRESMNLGLDMAWTNGRHSPDAFASLSARHV
ncbi:hypothetical protein PWT90_04784 [Aphanocladium album]|nr:hypothetical protein PWT90_04784 [Aphanocladium album]